MADNVLLTETEAAALLQISPRTLARYRYTCKSPAFVKIGPRVRYRLEDIKAWILTKTFEVRK